MPGHQIIGARRNVPQPKTSGTVGNGEIRVVKYQDHGAHVGMDVAENLYDAGPLECD